MTLAQNKYKSMQYAVFLLIFLAAFSVAFRSIYLHMPNVSVGQGHEKPHDHHEAKLRAHHEEHGHKHNLLDTIHDIEHAISDAAHSAASLYMTSEHDHMVAHGHDHKHVLHGDTHAGHPHHADAHSSTHPAIVPDLSRLQKEPISDEALKMHDPRFDAAPSPTPAPTPAPTAAPTDASPAAPTKEPVFEIINGVKVRIYDDKDLQKLSHYEYTRSDTEAVRQTRAALKKLAEQHGIEEGGVIFLTFANSAFKDLLYNWLENSKKLGIHAWIIGAMDKALEDELERKGLPYHSMADEGLIEMIEKNDEVTPMGNLSTGDFRSNHEAFRNMGVKKGGFALALLQLGYQVLIADVDAVILSDPRPFFQSAFAKSADLWVSTDCLSIAADKAMGKLSEEERTKLATRHDPWWRGLLQPYTREQNGNAFDANFNTGILFFYPTQRAEAFIGEWTQTIVHSGANIHGVHIWDDQQAFNVLARQGPRMPYWTTPVKFVKGGADRVVKVMNSRVNMGLLPLDLFQNGHTYFVQESHKLPKVPPPMMVHNTFQYQTTEGKKIRFKHQGLWLTEPDSYYTEGKFLTWAPELPAWLRAELEALYVPWAGDAFATPDSGRGPWLASHFRVVAHHIEAVRNGFALAEALGRTLVMPEMECHCDRYWYPIVNTCRSPGAELNAPYTCTLDMLFPLKEWRRINFRDHGFFRDPRVPAAVKESWAKVNVVDRKDYHQGAKGVAPRSMSDVEAKEVLAQYEDVRVLELSSMQDAFCRFEDSKRSKEFDNKHHSVLREQWCCHNQGNLYPDMPANLEDTAFDPSSPEVCKAPPGAGQFPRVKQAKTIENNCRVDKKCLGWNMQQWGDKLWWEQRGALPHEPKSKQ